MFCVMHLQEEREAAEKEKDEVDKLRTMGEEERRVELRNNPKVCHVLPVTMQRQTSLLLVCFCLTSIRVLPLSRGCRTDEGILLGTTFSLLIWKARKVT